MVYISPFILDEVSRNLERAFGLRQVTIEAILVFLRSRCTVLDPLPKLSLSALSPNDNRVLDCAVQGQAQYLVTGDREFLRLRQHQGVRIMNLEDFLPSSDRDHEVKTYVFKLTLLSRTNAT